MTITLKSRVPPDPPKFPRELTGSLAGAARVRLPWLKNIILTGWGPFQPLGVRYAAFCDPVPLCARVLVLEDPQGQRVALVALDLHGGSRYISEKAAHELKDEGFHPGNLFLSATHNHAGPGGLYGSRYYDAFAASTELVKATSASRLALNIELADFITKKVVSAVRTALARRTPAQIGQSSEWSGWARNRSLQAFRNNFPKAMSDAELEKVLAGSIGAQNGTLEEMAVDSRVHTIAAFKESAPHQLIGSFSTFAAHCALLSRVHNRQSPDFFGHATNALEKKLTPSQGERPVIALAAGAIGDCDPTDPTEPRMPLKELLELREDPFENQRLIERHAVQLAGVLERSISGAQSKLHPIERIKVAFSDDVIAGVELDNKKKLSKTPRIGTSTIAGAELGTGDMRFLGKDYRFSEKEGIETRLQFKTDAQFPKRVNRPFGDYGVPIRGTLYPLSTQHNRLNLRLVQIQCRDFSEPIRLLGVPGEPTTWLTHQLNQILRGAAPHRPTMVAGVTGDYQGYFTTSLEYDLQHYEGSSTIWGRETEGWLKQKVQALVTRIEKQDAKPEYSLDEVTFNSDEEDKWRTEFFDTPEQPETDRPKPDGVWNLR
ncbi:MAG: neutral/alkaline non-lysosomal ceramidase N-terminal domain-containing protein [Archangium sp.]|nr:neutral/alkaline non-lysosomal ceramidase N-terminal domain-containing protein [Archangium sp.]MDP3570537.1 neutral/alkaline non-lysosomal ceramidase N-terminal domain-containing protein [Archangium sp.]